MSLNLKLKKNVSPQDYLKMKKEAHKLAKQLERDPTDAELYFKLKEIFSLIDELSKD